MTTLTIQIECKATTSQRTKWVKLVQEAVKATFAHEKVGDTELTFCLSSDAEVQKLNLDFRGMDKPTNVLSFPSGENGYLGDVIISMETVAREAKEQGKNPDVHLSHLSVHACLHLLGHDHEEDAQASRMESQEIDILKHLGVANPYL